MPAVLRLDLAQKKQTELPQTSTSCLPKVGSPVFDLHFAGQIVFEVSAMDLPIVIDLESSTPIYLQISRAIKERIISGLLEPGKKLSSAQALASSLAVARSTVVKAYEDLAWQGYVEAVAGGGTFVSTRSLKAQELKYTVGTSETLSVLCSKYALQLEEQSLTSGASSVENEKLNYGAPAHTMLPTKDWKSVLLRECQSLETQVNDWAPEAFGLYRCRAAIAEFFCRAKGLKCSAEQIMLFAGCKESFPLTARLLLDEGDLVAIENPGYEDPRSHLKLANVELLSIDTDDHGLLVEDLVKQERKIKLVYVSPTQDPRGVILPLERRQALLEWASKNDTLIWEESWDSDYTYTPPQIPPLQGLAHGAENVIYSYCFWKVLYPLVTIGVLVIPLKLIPLFERARQIADIQFSLLEQRALADFIQEGLLDRHLKRSKKAYESRRRVLIESIVDELREFVEIPKQSSALHLCMRFEGIDDVDFIVSAAQEARLPLVSSHAYYLENARQNEFLVPFALFEEETIQERVLLFAEILKAKVSCMS